MPGDQFRVYVAIQFVVDIIVADVFQGSAASGAFETLYVKILVLDSYEDTSAEREREKEKEQSIRREVPFFFLRVRFFFFFFYIKG